MALIFLNCESTCDLTVFPTSIYGKKTETRPFDSDHDILRSVSRNLSSKSKCANLAPAGTNTYDTVGNERVNKHFGRRNSDIFKFHYRRTNT